MLLRIYFKNLTKSISLKGCSFAYGATTPQRKYQQLL